MLNLLTWKYTHVSKRYLSYKIWPYTFGANIFLKMVLLRTHNICSPYIIYQLSNIAFHFFELNIHIVVWSMIFPKASQENKSGYFYGYVYATYCYNKPVRSLIPKTIVIGLILNSYGLVTAEYRSIWRVYLQLAQVDSIQTGFVWLLWPRLAARSDSEGAYILATS